MPLYKSLSKMSKHDHLTLKKNIHSYPLLYAHMSLPVSKCGPGLAADLKMFGYCL